MFSEIEQLQKSPHAIANCSREISLKALGLGQLICCLGSSLEQRYHGILRYYQFVLDNNLIYHFFEADLRKTVTILKTLEALQEHNRHIEFLFQLAEHLERTLLYEDYFVIWIRCLQFFEPYSDHGLSQCFETMKAFAQSRHRSTRYIAIIYTVIMMKTSSNTLEKKLGCYIIKMVRKLHFYFQRQILTRFYENRLRVLERQSDRGKRR